MRAMFKSARARSSTTPPVCDSNTGSVSSLRRSIQAVALAVVLVGCSGLEIFYLANLGQTVDLYFSTGDFSTDQVYDFADKVLGSAMGF